MVCYFYFNELNAFITQRESTLSSAYNHCLSTQNRMVDTQNTTYKEDQQPLCMGKQLSRPHVNKGFPPTLNNTLPLYKHL